MSGAATFSFSNPKDKKSKDGLTADIDMRAASRFDSALPQKEKKPKGKAVKSNPSQSDKAGKAPKKEKKDKKDKKEPVSSKAL
jgi:hypothetical protein